MRYKPGHYAQALAEALAETTPETARAKIRAWVELLKKHRMLGKAEAIVRAVERELAKRAGVRRVLLESAVADSGAVQKEITGTLDGKVWIEEKIRPELLAGIRILIDDETLIDASGKRRLEKIFER